jgi:hypothetical protein
MNETKDFLPRMAQALFVGAVVGSSLTTLRLVLDAQITHGALDFARDIVAVGLAVFVGAFLVWFFGLVVVGFLPWVILHRLGCRNIFAACVFGLVAAFSVSLALRSHFFALPPPTTIEGAQEWYSGSEGPIEIDYKLTALGWSYALEGSAEIGAAGIIVAAAVWTTAYRPRIRRSPNAIVGS